MFNKVNKPDFIAFDETDISQHRVHCPQELTGTLPFSQVVEVLSSPVNIGTYLYYGRLKMASEWPRAYVAVERTTDPKEPLVVCIALLENRMKKKIHHLTVKEALEKFGTAKFEKMNSVTGIFQQPSREAEGKVSRQQCPPNLVNGTRSIASIIEVFQNPTYSGEYIYAGSIDMKDFKVGDKYVYDPYVVLQRNGNAVEVRLIGHHFERMISPKLQIDYSKRAPTIIKISLEQLKELGIKNVTKVPFVGPLKEHAKMRADDIAPPVVKTGQEVEFTREMSFTDLAQAMEKGVISPEYKHFYLV